VLVNSINQQAKYRFKRLTVQFTSYLHVRIVLEAEQANKKAYLKVDNDDEDYLLIYYIAQSRPM
jgi:hypothetical protein